MSETTKRIAELARQNAETLAKTWLPNVVLLGRNWVVGSVAGETGKSLSINLDKGLFKDFADPDSQGGDMVALCKAIFSLSFSEAIKRIEKDLRQAGTDSPALPSGRQAATDLVAIVPVPAGLPEPDLRIGRPVSSQEPNWHLRKAWAYRGENGELLFYVVRFDHASERDSKGKPKKKVLPFCYFGQSAGWRHLGHGLHKNPLYRLPELITRPTAPVLLVEGEKACDAAAALFPEYVCLSWMGGTGQIRKADFSPLANRNVTYWPDADKSGETSVAHIIEMLRLADAGSLKVVEPPSSLPLSWDLGDETPDGLNRNRLVDEARVVDLPAVKPLSTLNGSELVGRLVYNVGTEHFIDPESQIRLDASQLDALFRHVVEGRNKMPAILLANPKLRKVIAMTYRPGLPDSIFADANGNYLFNTWRPSRVKSCPGDAGLFEGHLRYLCPTDEEYGLLADSLAFMVQRPGEKLKFAPVLVGRQGTGKSAIASIMRKILGEHNTTVASTSEIRSDFNEWVSEKQLVVIEEIMALGRIEVMNTLKPLITESILSVNKKYVRRYEIENAANFIFLTNHRDALKLDDDDRRYFVIASDRAPNGQEYYKTFFDWAYANLGVILHWLESRDLSAFDPNRRPPMTAGKSQMIELSKDPKRQVVEQLILDCEPPFEHDLIELPKVHAFLIGRSGPLGGASLPRSVLMKILEGIGARMLGQQKATIRGVVERRSLWIIRNVEDYAALSQQEIVAIYLGYKHGEDSPF